MDSMQNSEFAVAPRLLDVFEMNLDRFYKPELLEAPDNWCFFDEDLNPSTDAVTPPTKKRKMCLSLKRRNATAPLKVVSNGRKRFLSSVKEKELIEAGKGVVPRNTRQNTDWATRVFRLWMEQRNGKVPPEEAIPSNILESFDHEVLCKYMRCFVLEVRREDSEHYNAGTIRSLLCGLNRYMKENGAPFSMLDKTDPAFRQLQLTLDTVTSTLHRDGIGTMKNSAAVISVEHDERFWEKGLLGIGDSSTLQKTVFFYVGLHFLLRGVEEQHSLVPAQIVPTSV